DGIAEADAGRVEIDLDGTGLAGRGIERDVREAGAGEEQRVAAFDRFLGWKRTEETNAAGGVRAVVGHGGLAEEGLDDGRTEGFGDLLQLFAGAESAAAGKDGDALTLVKDAGGAADVRFVRQA